MPIVAAGGSSQAAAAQGSSSGRPTAAPPPGRVRLRSRWLRAALSLMLLGSGMVTAVVAARHDAGREADRSRHEYAMSSTDIAAMLGLALEREADLVVTAAALVATDPDISNAEFARWAASVGAIERHPEVNGFGVVDLVPVANLPAFAARAEQDPAGTLAGRGRFELVPAGSRMQYCLARLMTFRPGATLPAGHDFCADATASLLGPGLAARDAGTSTYQIYRLNGSTYLGLELPIYRDGTIPDTVGQRRSAFLGWLAMSIDPKVLLARARSAHPDLAVTWKYDGGSDFAFSAGPALAAATTLTVPLGQGWTVQTKGVVEGGSVFGQASAREILLAGVSASLLLTALFLVLASSRARALTLVQRRTAALRDSEERFRAVVQNSSDLTIVADRDGTLTWVSPACREILGRTEQDLIGCSMGDLAWPEDRCLLERRHRDAVAGVAGGRLECRLTHPDGTARWAEATFTNLLDTRGVSGIVLNVRDVTERHRLQTDLRQAQKLEAVGQLASGVAHEINTPIQFVGDNLRFLGGVLPEVLSSVRQSGTHDGHGSHGSTSGQGSVPDDAQGPDNDFDLDAEVTDAIEQSLAGIDRVSRIVQAMRTFGYRDGATPAAADLNEALKATLVIARNEYKYIAEVATDFGDLPPVLCFVSELSQVFLNLVVNAAHAIAARYGGSGQLGLITVRTWTENQSVFVSVADTGAGMEAEVARRVFEPFFTTKPVGQGTGQGLSIAYATVVSQHGGSLDFRTAPGEGTTFTVEIPIAGATRGDPEPSA